MEKTKITGNQVIDVYDCGRAKIVKCYGFIDYNNYPHLEAAVEKLIKAGSFSIIVDLEKVEFISSAGWGIFLGNVRKAEENKGYIRLAHMQERVKEVFELLNLGSLLQHYKTIEEAIGPN